MSLQHPWVPAHVEAEHPSGNLNSEDLPEDDLVSAGRWERGLRGAKMTESPQSEVQVWEISWGIC